ncbi:MAG: DUF1289 domain-containing protein [Pseudomonadota bacterium]
MQSPCVLVCAIDDKTGFCFGCGRTRDEIGGWTLYTDDQRSKIMNSLDARMATLETKPRRVTKRQALAERRAQAER